MKLLRFPSLNGTNQPSGPVWVNPDRVTRVTHDSHGGSYIWFSVDEFVHVDMHPKDVASDLRNAEE